MTAIAVLSVRSLSLRTILWGAQVEFGFRSSRQSRPIPGRAILVERCESRGWIFARSGEIAIWFRYLKKLYGEIRAVRYQTVSDTRD